MAHLLFAAHDPGAANMLAPVMRLARKRGHRVTTIGEAGSEDPMEAMAPDLLVTGTGHTDFERRLWPRARDLGIDTVAVIDTWTNLRKRFTEGGETVEPDAVCVVDEEMREQMGWCGARLHVTGQPHLQSVVDRLAPRRAGRGASDPPLLVFFSEPLSRDYGAEDVGFDEFGVADALLSGIAGAGPLTLLVQPHPREDREEWRAWLSGRHGVADVSTEDLLVTCDGALGMTTMVLFEAALLGVPVLSLQPGRRRPLNPRLDAVKGLHRVTDDADIGPALARFLGALGEAVSIDHGLSDVIANADQRLLAAIEKELPAGCRQPQGTAST